MKAMAWLSLAVLARRSSRYSYWSATLAERLRVQESCLHPLAALSLIIIDYHDRYYHILHADGNAAGKSSFCDCILERPMSDSLCREERM